MGIEHMNTGRVPDSFDKVPQLEEVPVPSTPEKTPDVVTTWPTISELGEDDELPGETPEKKNPPTLH